MPGADHGYKASDRSGTVSDDQQTLYARVSGFHIPRAITTVYRCAECPGEWLVSASECEPSDGVLHTLRSGVQAKCPHARGFFKALGAGQ